MYMRVLIVDDEERQRSGIVKHVDWNALGMTVTGEAESAQQAIEITEECPPDILITDIRLLGMDGLELSRALRQINRDLRIVIVTGYEEYDYAKSALDLNVEAFLVKPVDFRELVRVLEQIGKSYSEGLKKQEEEDLLREQLKELLPIAREKFLQEIINGLVYDESAARICSNRLSILHSSDMYAVAVVAADNYKRSLQAEEDETEVTHLKILRAANNALGGLIDTSTTSQGVTVFIMKCTGQPDMDKGFKSKIGEFHREVERELDCKINIGIGPGVDFLCRIADSFHLAQRALKQGLLLGSGQITHWHDTGETEAYRGIETEGMIRELMDALRIGEKTNVDALFKTIIQVLVKSDTVTETETISICMELVSGAVRIIREMGVSSERHFGQEKDLWKQIMDCDGAIRMIQQTQMILDKFCDLISEHKKSRYRQIVQSIMNYVEEHYNEDISLQGAADKVYLSANYAGAVLRTEMGRSFTDYLAGVRIGKAKELLKNPQLKLYEVSERVGYQNPAYFTNLFKRHTGLLPKEYRNTVYESKK